MARRVARWNAEAGAAAGRGLKCGAPEADVIFMRPLRRLRQRLSDDSGAMLLELVISLMFLSVAVGALLSVFSSSMISLRLAGISGTAQTLVEQQMEAYKAVPYTGLRLSSSTVPPTTSSYFKNPPAAVGSSFTNVTGDTTDPSACVNPVYAKSGCATQTVVGPDGRTYRIDSYLVSATPTGGRAGVRVTVAVRLLSGTTPTKIEAQTTSAFDPASPSS